MALRTLVAATVAAVLAAASQVSAHVPAPLVPTALVEDVKSATADIEFMDYVGKGQVIKLDSRDVLVLSYLKSCEHETITGGTVIVGSERSDVQDGQIVRSKVPCDGGKMRLSSEQASKSAASAFRLQSADIQPTLFARTPMVQLPKVLASEEDFRSYFGQESADPSLWFVAWRGSRVAGVALCRLAKGIGEVYEVSVAHPHRRRGVARALLSRGVAELERRQPQAVRILTRKEFPTQAWRLYESVGFRVIKEFPRWRKEISR